MDNNEIIEVVEEIEVMDSSKGGFKTAALVAGSAVVGVMLWNRVIKPVGRMLKDKLNAKKTDGSDFNIEDMDIDDTDYNIQ